MTTRESLDCITWGCGKACAQMNETEKKKLQCKQTLNNVCEN